MKLHPSLSKEKIQGTYFEICQTYFELCPTYFELCPTYFSPLENPYENRAKNADKFRLRGFVLHMKDAFHSCV